MRHTIFVHCITIDGRIFAVPVKFVRGWSQLFARTTDGHYQTFVSSNWLKEYNIEAFELR